jgi:DNA-binding NtrC family response regulator
VDIAALLHHFIERRSEEMGIKNSFHLAPGAMDRLMSYGWPGNVRELENTIERELIMRRETSMLLFEGLGSPVEKSRPTVAAGESQPTLTFDDHAAALIRAALAQANGRVEGKGGASELLAINPSTLRNRMQRLGIPYGRMARRVGWPAQ